MKWAAWTRRLAWPLGITLLVLLGALDADDAVFANTEYSGIPGLELIRPPLYVALAPLSDVLDTISLLSVPQLIGLAASLLAIYIAWRLLRWRRVGTSGWCEFCAGLRAFLVFTLVIMLAAVLPRPMAALRVSDPDWVVFDIHSHTNYSHDARSTFTVEANRAWHRDAGFDVAYVTDHRCFDGAAEGMRANPKRAGGGTVLLSGIELPADQLHLVVLEPPDAAAPDGLLEGWCVRADRGRPPRLPAVKIQTIPEDLVRVQAAMADPALGVSAIEISDGAPRGIAQALGDAQTLRDLWHRHHLATVAGSNNHGWGRTAVAWNVMFIKGWRDLAPDSLGRVIEMRIRAEREHAVIVVERNGGSNGTGRIDPWAPVSMAAGIARSMSMPERLSWLAWTWGIMGIVVLVRRRRR